MYFIRNEIYIDILEHNCPGDNYMRCKAENICMVDMLKCDGIQHCDDGSDEENCEGLLQRLTS